MYSLNAYLFSVLVEFKNIYLQINIFIKFRSQLLSQIDLITWQKVSCIIN